MSKEYFVELHNTNCIDGFYDKNTAIEMRNFWQSAYPDSIFSIKVVNKNTYKKEDIPKQYYLPSLYLAEIKHQNYLSKKLEKN